MSHSLGYIVKRHSKSMCHECENFANLASLWTSRYWLRTLKLLLGRYLPTEGVLLFLYSMNITRNNVTDKADSDDNFHETNNIGKLAVSLNWPLDSIHICRKHEKNHNTEKRREQDDALMTTWNDAASLIESDTSGVKCMKVGCCFT